MSVVLPVKVKNNLPKQIKVGPYTFSINERGMAWYQNQGHYGQMLPDALEIDVTINFKPIVVLDTLIHEIYHAIWYVCHLEDKDDEERTVATMATAWIGVLRDNPELVEFQNLVLTDYHNK